MVLKLILDRWDTIVICDIIDPHFVAHFFFAFCAAHSYQVVSQGATCCLKRGCGRIILVVRSNGRATRVIEYSRVVLGGFRGVYSIADRGEIFWVTDEEIFG